MHYAFSALRLMRRREGSERRVQKMPPPAGGGTIIPGWGAFSRTLISRRDARGCDGGVREELAAGVSLNALSAFGAKQTCTVVWLRPPRS
jgi:hypothetical protein